ncbi:unnamed protein product [Cylicocyclus nassatus]|uniref:Saposin B-type domain-containing protein n=1 Tax=Cylicocyclus nassatus TaxID=53992 RepID=A0AA36GKL8_CYLNA|nr:unnamed protein product [Cylicocyclus nassatus]
MKTLLLFSLIFCAVLAAYDIRFSKEVSPGPIPPFCQNCLDLVEKLKVAFKEGKEVKALKEIAHKFCKEILPPQLKVKCHHKVERHWKKVMKMLEITIDYVADQKYSSNEIWNNYTNKENYAFQDAVDSKKMCQAFRLCN